MYRYAIKVYGCQMNVYDGDKLKTALGAAGWSEATEEEADVVILNGCSIRDKAEQKVWSDLGRFAPRWGREGRPFVAVTGCVAQNAGRKMLSRFPWVRFISGPRHIGAVPEGLERLMACPGEAVMLLDDDPRAFKELGGAPWIGATRGRPTSQSPTAATTSAPTASSPTSGAGFCPGPPARFWTKCVLWRPTALKR